MSNAKTDYVKLEYQLLDLVEYNELKITGNMKILLSLIYSYEKESRTYYESITTLGKRLGLEPQATRSLITKLCTAGMISYEERKGTSHIFHSKPLNKDLMILIGEEKPKKSRQAASKKTQEKQENGKSEIQAKQAEPKAEQAATAATPPDNPADNVAAGSVSPIVGQHDRVASNDNSGGNDGSDGATSVDNEDIDPPFPPEKPAQDDIPEGFTPPGELAHGEKVEGERLGYAQIHEEAGAG